MKFWFLTEIFIDFIIKEIKEKNANTYPICDKIPLTAKNINIDTKISIPMVLAPQSVKTRHFAPPITDTIRNFPCMYLQITFKHVLQSCLRVHCTVISCPLIPQIGSTRFLDPIWGGRWARFEAVGAGLDTHVHYPDRISGICMERYDRTGSVGEVLVLEVFTKFI